MNKIKKILTNKHTLRSIGLLIFVYILTKVDIIQIFTQLKNIDILTIIFVILLFIPQILTKAIRWKLLMQQHNIKYNLLDCFLMYASGMYIGTLTFGRLGEFTRVFYLKNDGHKLGKSFTTVLFDRLFDVIFHIMFGAFGLILFFKIIKITQAYFAVLLIIVLILLFLVIKRNKMFGIINKTAKRFIPKKYKKKIKFDVKQLLKINFKVLVYSMILTALTWAIYFFQVYLLVKSAAIPISYFFLAISLSVSALITMIPISISGIGTRDATLIFLFSYIGLSKELAIGTSISVLIIYFLMACLGLLAWIKKPINYKKRISN